MQHETAHEIGSWPCYYASSVGSTFDEDILVMGDGEEVLEAMPVIDDGACTMSLSVVPVEVHSALGPIPLSALLDTGATISLVSPDVAVLLIAAGCSEESTDCRVKVQETVRFD